MGPRGEGGGEGGGGVTQEVCAFLVHHAAAPVVMCGLWSGQVSKGVLSLPSCLGEHPV